MSAGIINNKKLIKQIIIPTRYFRILFVKSDPVTSVHIAPTISPQVSTINAAPQADVIPPLRFSPNEMSDRVTAIIDGTKERNKKNLSKNLLPFELRSLFLLMLSVKIANRGSTIIKRL